MTLVSYASHKSHQAIPYNAGEIGQTSVNRLKYEYYTTTRLSNLNQPRAAHCKSYLKVGHLKQN